MKYFFSIIVFVLVSCNSKKVDTQLQTKDSIQQLILKDSASTASTPIATESKSTRLCAWIIDFDNKTKKRNPYINKEDLTIDSLIKGLNILYPNIMLTKINLSRDTLYTEIKNSKYLTEQMGSSGAAAYFADVVINLTAIAKVKYVKINFTEGSHALPDTWSEKDFYDYKEIR